MEADVFSREPNGIIALRLTPDEFDELMKALGFACGCAAQEQSPATRNAILRLENLLNAGNPDFIPYEVHAEADA